MTKESHLGPHFNAPDALYRQKLTNRKFILENRLKDPMVIMDRMKLSDTKVELNLLNQRLKKLEEKELQLVKRDSCF